MVRDSVALDMGAVRDSDSVRCVPALCNRCSTVVRSRSSSAVFLHAITTPLDSATRKRSQLAKNVILILDARLRNFEVIFISFTLKPTIQFFTVQILSFRPLQA